MPLDRKTVKELATELGKRRWHGVAKKDRQKAAQAASNARWERWRAENPEKAKASEARRRKRAKGKA